MDTALELIQSALRLLGVIASGESLSAAEATDGLAALNDLLDSWSTQELLVPTRIREVFPLVANQQTYKMGVGAPDFNTARPIRIENALLQYSGVSPVLELPMDILNKEEYAAILLKSLSSTIPLSLYEDNAFPYDNLSVWPVPQTSYNLVLYSWKPLADLASLTTELSLPPGYQRALRFNLAVDLAPEYGKEPSATVIAEAVASKGNIKRVNLKPSYLKVDKAARGKPGVWDYRTGDYR